MCFVGASLCDELVSLSEECYCERVRACAACVCVCVSNFM